MSESAEPIVEPLRPSRNQRLVLVLVGLLLVVAAGLKMLAMAGDVRMQSHLGNLIILAFLEAEAFLGLWLLIGVRHSLSWHLAIAFFLGAICVDVTSLIHGKTDCGCFGDVSMSPWVPLVISVFFLSALLVFRPPINVRYNAGTGVRGIVRHWPVAACIVFPLLGLTSAFIMGSYFEVIVAQPATIDLGHVDRDEVREVAISLRNLGSRETTVMGARTSCTCRVIRGLPAKIVPGGQLEIVLRIKPAGGKFSGRVLFYTDQPTSAPPSFAYRGEVETRTIPKTHAGKG